MLSNKYPEGSFDRTQPYECHMKVIQYDGIDIKIFDNVPFKQRSFYNCLYDGGLEFNISYSPHEINTVIHVFGNPESYLVENNDTYVLAIITNIDAKVQQINMLKVALINTYIQSILDKAKIINSNINKHSKMCNEVFNKNLSNEYNKLFKLGSKVRINIKHSEKIEPWLIKELCGATGTISEIINIEDINEDEIMPWDLYSRYYVKLDARTKFDKTEMYFDAIDLELI